MKSLRKRYQAQFEEFNTQYFGGKLPHYRIKVQARIPGWGGGIRVGKIYRKQRIIMLVPNQEPYMKGHLLHEMAHAATNKNHGPKWIGEMKRLQAAGAPVSDDLDQYGQRLTKDFIKTVASDWVTDCPSITLREFLKLYLHEYGGSSARGMLRKYPWIRNAFYEGREEARKLSEAVKGVKWTASGSKPGKGRSRPRSG